MTRVRLPFVVLLTVAVCAIWPSLGSDLGAQERVNPQAATLAEFMKRVSSYIDLEKKVTAGLPPLTKTDDPVEIASRELATAAAVRAARQLSKPGDVLFDAVAKIFRKEIKDDFRRRSARERKLMRDDIPNFRPRINQEYPAAWPLATFPPTLLARMPTLPDGIEYRLLSNALILRDVKANLIIDFILDVF